MKHVGTCIMFLFILTSLIPLYAKEQEKLRVAIMDFSGEDVAPRDAKKVSDLIRTEMINTGKYTIIERNEMGKILQEQGFSMTVCSDVSCAVQAGKLLSASKMLVGTIMKLGENLIINGRIIDVEKGTAEFAQKEIAQSRLDLVRAVDAFVVGITNRMAPKRYAKQYSDFERKTTGRTPASDYGYAAIPFLGLSIIGAGVAIHAGKQYRKYRNLKKQYEKSPINMIPFLIFTTSFNFDLRNYSYSRLFLIINNGSKYKYKTKEFEDLRLYSAIASGVTGGVAIILGIVWLTKLSEEGRIGANGDINIDQQFALTLPPQYYNDCFNFSEKNQFGFGLGLVMKF